MVMRNSKKGEENQMFTDTWTKLISEYAISIGVSGKNKPGSHL